MTKETAGTLMRIWMSEVEPVWAIPLAEIEVKGPSPSCGMVRDHNWR